uniref:Uncharacterized protein n=1 Tax=Romanomermis culicivorax TaxID=13658 RepID=A0A915KPN9_ROMCU
MKTYAKWKIHLFETKYSQAASGWLAPLLGIGLAIYDISEAVKNYKNGDHSTTAVYGIVPSLVFLGTSLMALGASIVSFAAGTSAVPSLFTAAVYIIGTTFYTIGHAWKGVLEIDRISDQISMSGLETARQIQRVIFGLGINEEFTKASNDKEWNMHRLKIGIQHMEKNTDIRNFISSAACYDIREKQFAPCTNIKIDLREKSSELGKDILDLTLQIGGRQPLIIIGKHQKITVEGSRGTLAEISMKHINRIRVGTQVGNDRLKVYCNIKNIDVVENMKNIYDGYPMRMGLNGEDCYYNLTITLRGYVNISSIAKYDGYKDDVKVKLYHNGTEISVHMNHGADSLEIAFKDGITINYSNGSFYTNQLFPKSKARLWADFNRIINLCKEFGIKFQAYSERDQEFFTLKNESIQFYNSFEMNFSIFDVHDREEDSFSQPKQVITLSLLGPCASQV